MSLMRQRVATVRTTFEYLSLLVRASLPVFLNETFIPELCTLF